MIARIYGGPSVVVMPYVPRRVVAWALLSFACGSPDGEAELAQLSSAVVRGEASDESQNSVVLLVREDFAQWCTGSVVAPNLILTARHCLYDALVGENDYIFCEEQGRTTPILNAWDPTSFAVYVGSAKPLPPAAAHGIRIYSGRELDVCDNDVGLLEIDTPLPMTPFALRLDTGPSIGELGTLVGWGATLEDLETGGSDLLTRARQQREIRIEALGPTNYAPPNGPPRFLEASAFIGTEGGCVGDSGGPLISRATGAIIGVEEASQHVDPVIGLNTGDIPMECLESFTVFQRLDLQEEWLRKAFRSAGTAPWLEGAQQPAPFQAACTSADDCQSGLCVSAGLSNFCSVRCDVDPCPDGAECLGPNGGRVCAPVVTRFNDANGCALAPPDRQSGGLLAWLLAVPLGIRRCHRWLKPAGRRRQGPALETLRSVGYTRVD